jgi:NADH-quinone oxidoreductase subunit J
VATLATFFFLAMLLGTLSQVTRNNADESSDRTLAASASTANPFSRAEDGASINTLRSLGRSLFGDYLFAVELAGTLLLVATIGAIAIAPRRRRGTL